MSIINEEHQNLNEFLKQTLHASLYNHNLKYINAQKRCFQLLETDPLLTKKFFDISDDENRESTMRQIRRVFQIRNKLLRNDTEKDAFMNVLDLYDRSLHMRLYVHFTLFKETLLVHGTKELTIKYLNLIEKGQILGCFAMTELGHSSFLRGIETIATFDKENDEFVITTLSLLGTKWWIGMAGQVATHTVALAHLEDSNGKKHGLHWFLIPLRNPETGELLPGVTAGHLGAKAGRGGLDNGWITFSSCRIPRANMLQRFVTVSSSGEVSSTDSNPVFAYMTLIGERIAALKASFNIISQAIVIALRYGVLRRQGPSNEKILDYPTHTYFLMPILSGSFAIAYIHNNISESWNTMQDKFNSSECSSMQFLEEIKYFHALAAGCKAFLSWWIADALEVCRRCGGGHFYSAYNAIPSLIADFGVITTGGGDNMTLSQQCGLYLLKQLQNGSQNSSLHPSLQYLNSPLPKNDDSVQFETLNDVLSCLKWTSIYMLKQTASLLSESNSDSTTNWHDNQIEIAFCSEPHIYYITLLNLKAYANDEKNKSIKSIIHQMGMCFGLSILQKFIEVIVSGGYLNIKQVPLIRRALLKTCMNLRKSCISISDSFGYPDFLLKSPLASYDASSAYEKYFSIVKGNTTVAPYWNKEVLPLLSYF